MKKRQIENIIERDVKQATPDVFHKIQLEKLIEEHAKPKRKPFWQQKRNRLALAFTALFVVMLGVIGVMRMPTSPQPSSLLFDDQLDIFTVAAMTSIGRYEQVVNDTNETSSNAFAESLGFNESELSALSNHVAIIEAFVQNPERMQFTRIDSPLEDYDTMIIFTGHDLRFNPIEFTMHVNLQSDDNEYQVFHGLVVLSYTRYEITGGFDAVNTLEGDFTIQQVDNPDVLLHTQHRFTEEGQRYTYALTQNGEHTALSSLAFTIDQDVVQVTVDLADSDMNFTMVKTQNGFTQKLNINYNHNHHQGTLVLRVAFNTETSLYHYQFTSSIDTRNVIVTMPRNIPLRS